MPTDTNRLTREEMHRRGWLFEKVERFRPHSNTHRDLFGLFDYLALAPRQRIIVGIQSTTRAEAGRHRQKMLHEHTEALRQWLACGGAALLWGWYVGVEKPAGRSNHFRKPAGEFSPNKKLFLYEQELVSRDLWLKTGPDPILDAGSI